MVLGEKVSKTLTWFDNGWGYAHRVVDLIRASSELDSARRGGACVTIRVGINGFGRIGRSVFRILADRDDIEVVAINDLYENEQLAYLLKYDTVMRVFAKEVTADDEAMYVDGKKIAMTAEKDPAADPLGEARGGRSSSSRPASSPSARSSPSTSKAGAKKVILTVPAKDEIDAMIVVGVNDETLKPEHRLVSNASCTTNCLAPLAKILDEAFGIEEGFITTVHAYTNDQRLADVPHKDLRRSRAAAQNIIPTTTGAARAVGKVLPQLEGQARRHGDARAGARRLDRRPGLPAADEASVGRRSTRRSAGGGRGRSRGIVEYSEVPLVSSDIIGNPHSSIFDALSTTPRATATSRSSPGTTTSGATRTAWWT